MLVCWLCWLGWVGFIWFSSLFHQGPGDVATWLRGLSLKDAETIITNFENEGVDGGALLSLTEKEIEQLVPRIGD